MLMTYLLLIKCLKIMLQNCAAFNIQMKNDRIILSWRSHLFSSLILTLL